MLASFSQAIAALFGSDPLAQSQANTFLTSFSATSDAWQCALALIAPSSDEAASFFCSNLLLNKARKEWSHINQQTRDAIKTEISQKLNLYMYMSGPSSNGLVHLRICQVMAAVVANEGLEGSSSLVQSTLTSAFGMINMIRSSSTSPDAGGSTQILAANLSSHLSLLQYVAEEIEGVIESWAKKQAFIQSLNKDYLHSVINLIQEIISLSISTDQSHIKKIAAIAIGCLNAWLKLDPSGSGGLCLSPGEIKAMSPNLFPALIRCLGGLRGEGDALSSEVLTHLCGPGKTAPGDEAALMEVSMEIYSCYSQLILTQPVISSVSGIDAWVALARDVSSIITSISEREIRLVAVDGAGDGGKMQLSLAQLMLASLSHAGSLRNSLEGEEGVKGRRVAEAVLDYLVIINTISTAERIPMMCKHLFTQALEPMLLNAQYPRGFTVSWDDCTDDDEDEFYRFRSQQLSEGLECCYGMMRLDLLLSLYHSHQQCISSQVPWQRFESILFCLQAIGSKVRERVLGRDGKGPKAISGGDAQAQALAQEYEGLKTLLLSVFNHLCGSKDADLSNGLLSNPMVAAAACKLIGEYGIIFEAFDEAPREGALTLTLRCLAIPSPQPSTGSSIWQKAAAAAFRSLCIKCATRLSNDTSVLLSLVSDLVDAATSIVAPPLSSQSVLISLGQEERNEVFEGLSRAISVGFEKLGPDQVGDAGLRLTRPLLARAESCSQSLGSNETLSILASDLSLLSSIVRFLDGGPGLAEPQNQHPVMKVLQGAWPILGGIAQSPACQSSPPVINSLCEVFTRSLLSAKRAARTLLPTLTVSLLSIYNVSQIPCVCEVLGTVCEVFGELRESGSEEAGLQKKTFEQICIQSSILFFIRSTSQDSVVNDANKKHMAEHADQIRALYSLSDRFLIFARGLLLGSDALPFLLSSAPMALCLRDKDAMSSLLAFLSHLITLTADGSGGLGVTSDEDSVPRSRLIALLAAEASRLIQSLLLAVLLGTCPTTLIRSLGSCLRLLVDQPSPLGLDPPLIASLVAQAISLASASNPAVVNVGRSTDSNGREASTDQGWERFVHLVALRQPRLPRGRFEAMVMDVASVLERGIAGSLGNALIAYEL